MADFDGRSALLYRFNQKSMSTVKDVISLRFKSRQAEGVLLHGEGQRGDYITLELHRGKLALYLNLGNTKSMTFYLITLKHLTICDLTLFLIDRNPVLNSPPVSCLLYMVND